MRTTTLTKSRVGAAIGLGLLAAGSLWLGGPRAARRAGQAAVYTASGYGGFVTPASPKPAPRPTVSDKTGKAALARRADPVRAARLAYSAGRYGEAEMAAQAVVSQAAHTKSVPLRRRAAFARQVLAYSAARRHDLPLARARFAALETEAAKLPDGGKPEARLGEDPPTLTEEAAFQHAVCTGALGDKGAAEAEYVAFMKGHPDSPLVGAALKRIARLHGGDVPKEDEAVWRRAQRVAQARQRARMRAASLCGPECLAELLRRRGEAADVRGLAKEMGTGERGTTLSALAGAAKRRGFHPRGLALTPRGLTRQRLPLVALVAPGHYVLVEGLTAGAVTVWDPDARGVGRGDRRAVPAAEWGRMWRGTALAL